MQQVKQLLILLTLVAGFSLNAQAQACDPDTTTPAVPALYPDTLMDGKVGQVYSQVITLVIPQDSAVNVPPFGTLEIDICSLSLDSVPNLPPGMTYECNTPDCIWQVNHDSGYVNRGCVILSGTPTDTLLGDTLEVYVRINPGAYDAVNDTCAPLQINLPPELTTVVYRPRFHVEPDSTWVNGIEDYALRDFKLQLFPNPTQSKSHLRYSLPERVDDVEIRLTDMMGRVVQRQARGPQAPGEYEVEIGHSGLSAGIYLVSINLNQGARMLTRKLVVE